MLVRAFAIGGTPPPHKKHQPKQVAITRIFPAILIFISAKTPRTPLTLLYFSRGDHIIHSSPRLPYKNSERRESFSFLLFLTGLQEQGTKQRFPDHQLYRCLYPKKYSKKHFCFPLRFLLQQHLSAEVNLIKICLTGSQCLP